MLGCDMGTEPRGIAVVDMGATNSKVLLFDAAGALIAARRTASAHRPAPPYAAIDPEPFCAFLPGALAELDGILPIDAIVPSAHGSALALLKASGDLALPIMDYTAEPPPDVRAAYLAQAPAFTEVFCPVAPLALCLGLQLYWQETRFRSQFNQTQHFLPLAQYVAYRLSGVRVSEVTTLGAQSQLWDVAHNRSSSIARALGWDHLMAPMAKAWDVVGALTPAMRLAGFQGAGRVRAGVHDSNANYLRYLAGELRDFTLLSTGTWIIGFAPGADIHQLDPARDTVTNTDVFGRPVASCRFMGGREFELVAESADPAAADLTTVAVLIARGTFALPSFTASGGPMPGTEGEGRIEGPAASTLAERASLATLYCALMTAQSIAAVRGTGAIIVDGPFTRNISYLAILAALFPERAVLASDLDEGTAAGAALLARISAPASLPRTDLDLRAIAAAQVEGLAQYQQRWLEGALRRVG